MLENLKNIKYLKRTIILCVDTFISLFATMGAYMFILSLYRNFNGDKVFLYASIGSGIISFLLFWAAGIYRNVIRYFTAVDIVKIAFFVTIKATLVTLVGLYAFGGFDRFPIYAGILDLMITFIVLIYIRSALVGLYYYMLDKAKSNINNSFIYSTRGLNPTLVTHNNKNAASKYRIKGFLTTNRAKVGAIISSEKVYFVNDKSLKSIFLRNHINTVIFTSQNDLKFERENLVEFCIANKIKMIMMGNFEAINDDGTYTQSNVKSIHIEDLLERDEIKVNVETIAETISKSVVMVTGAAGSIGSEIARQVASFKAKELILFDCAETPLHNIQLELRNKYPNATNIHYVLGDVRSRNRVKVILERYKPDIIFHAAAYKHVPMVELNPCEGVLANVWGTINVAQQASAVGVSKFIMISTDKAVNPTNVMGATKRVAEMCVQHMNSLSQKTEFVITRFGNVLGSNGSVIPLFKSQIEAGGPVTVTDPNIVRYFMTIPEACSLVLQAATMGHAGDILVFDMGQQVRIADFARKMIKLAGFEPDVDIMVKYTGLRPGEKLYEEVLSSKENTTATSHEKIRVAKINAEEVDGFINLIRELVIIARRGETIDSVKLLKQIAPEFKSNNSMFENLDK